MAKKDKKKDKQKGSDATDAVAAVRSAVERTFQATTEGPSGKRLVEEITHAAARVRETMDQLKILDDVRGLRAEIEALSRRVAALEIVQRGAVPAPSRPAPAKRTTAKRSAARRFSSQPAAKRASSKPAAKRASSQPAATRARTNPKPRAKRAS